MRIRMPVSWLREYVEVPAAADDLARALHLSGTEVDHVERAGEAWERIWVGRVSDLAKHPNADRLTLATVEYGEGRSRTVVTGAGNLAVGAVVAYAEAGARLREGQGDGTLTLEPQKIRGVRSEGMVCSARELGLGEDHEGILLLDPALPVGARLADALGEAVLHLELQPNRPDCLGVVGVAREVAALYRGELREPAVERLVYGALGADRLSVRIEDADGCARFAAAYLEGVRVGPSPPWLQRRLVAAGMRPIANVVDITNYVMLEMGH
ncbi:MAG: phenylalanine--tRNA ligase beta subunit-related protein, partial [Thermoleophilaceae bacterium]